MNTVLMQRLEGRAAEVNAYLTFVNMVSSQSAKLLIPEAKRRQRRVIDEQVVKILKANCFLLLYNTVEATPSSSLIESSMNFWSAALIARTGARPTNATLDKRSGLVVTRRPAMIAPK